LGKDIKVYRELLSDAHLGGIVESRKAGTLSLEREVVQNESETSHFKLVKSVFDSLEMDEIISEILDAPLFGYQPLEITWERVGNVMVPTCVQGKPPEWFVFSSTNELRFRTRSNPQGIELPPRKFLLARNEPTYTNPYGNRVLSKCFWPVTFKRGGYKFWIKFVEKFGMPHVIGKHPRGTSDDETNRLLSMLEAMVQDAIAVIPDDSSVEILESPFKTNSSQTYQDLLTFSNMEMSKVVLGQTLTTQMQDVGARAASETHMQVRGEIVNKDKKIVQKTFNALIRFIFEVNFPTVKNRPFFQFFEEEDVDKDLADRDKTLSDQGVRLSKSYYEKAYGFEKGDIEEIKTPTATGSQFQERSEKDFSVQEDIDELGDHVVDNAAELQAQAEAILDVIFEVADRSGSYEEFSEKIAKTYPEMDSDRLLSKVEKGIFVSHIWSRLNGSKG